MKLRHSLKTLYGREIKVLMNSDYRATLKVFSTYRQLKENQAAAVIPPQQLKDINQMTKTLFSDVQVMYVL